jgi:hypothetical protein
MSENKYFSQSLRVFKSPTRKALNGFCLRCENVEKCIKLAESKPKLFEVRLLACLKISCLLELYWHLKKCQKEDIFKSA